MKHRRNKLIGLILGLIVGSIVPLISMATQELTYTLQVPLLGLTKVNSVMVMDYFVAFYKFGVYLTVAFAFLGLVYGAFVYMTSGGNSGMQQHGRDYLWGAIWGLLIILGGWALLNTINPELVKFKLPQIQEVKNQASRSVENWKHKTYTWQCSCDGFVGCSKGTKKLPPGFRFVGVSSDKCHGLPMPDNCENICQGYFIVGGRCLDKNCGGVECCDYQELSTQPN